MDLHDEIIEELSKQFDLSKYELNKIITSQFRVVENIVTNKECKTINCMGLGKFYPTAYRVRLEDGKTTGNN